MNQGAEALARSGSISDLAKLLNVNPRTISGWRSGAKVPNDASKSNLERVVGIERRLWDRAVATPTPKAPPRVRTPETYWVVPQRCPWLTFGHPLANLTVRRLALASVATAAADDELGALDAEIEALRARHPGLVADVERAELTLGIALALETDDECAASFLGFHGKGAHAHGTA